MGQMSLLAPACGAMRADLLRLVRSNDPVKRIDCDFRHLFASWFYRGFLVLRRISRESLDSIAYSAFRNVAR